MESALYELLKYANKYSEQVSQSLLPWDTV